MNETRNRIQNSPLIESATVSSLRWFGTWHGPYIIFSIVGVFFLYAIMVSVLGVIGMNVTDISESLADLGRVKPWQVMVGLILFFIPFFIAVWLWVRFFERRTLITNGLLSPQPVVEYLGGLASGFIMLTAIVVIMALLGQITVENPFNQLAIGASIMVGIGWIVQGAAEEFFTRGFITQIVGRRYGIAAGIMISAIIFTILHGSNNNVTLLALTNLMLVSVFLSIYSLQEGALWGVFAWHSVWNWAQGNLFGFEVSGNDLTQASIVLDLAENGPDWITGGAFGLEGGLIATVVLVAGIGWLLIRGPRSVRTSTQ